MSRRTHRNADFANGRRRLLATDWLFLKKWVRSFPCPPTVEDMRDELALRKLPDSNKVKRVLSHKDIAYVLGELETWANRNDRLWSNEA